MESSPVKITANKASRSDVKFWIIKITSRKIAESSSFKYINGILTSIRCQFNVLCPLGTQPFIIPPIVITLEVFESQRSENSVKLAFQKSEKETINQSVTRSTGQLKFIKVLKKVVLAGFIYVPIRRRINAANKFELLMC